MIITIVTTILSFLVVVLFIALIITTNHLDARMTHIESHLKEYSEELKSIKNMLRAEIPETTQAQYAEFMKKNLSFKTYDEAMKEHLKNSK